MTTITLNLSKGENINLTKEHANVVKYRVGLGWDANESRGATYDLDASVLFLNENQRLMGSEFICYFGRKNIAGVIHHGDNLTGSGTAGADDETIDIDLSKIPANTSEVIVFVDIYQAKNKGQNFGQISNSYIKLYNADTKAVIAKYNLGDEFAAFTLVHFGSFKKLESGEWTFKAVGKGSNYNILEFANSLS